MTKFDDIGTIAKKGLDFLGGLGEVGVTTAEGVSKIAYNVGHTAGSVAAYGVKTVGDNLLRENPKRLLGFELNKKGKAAFLTVGLGASILGANDAYDQSRMGTPAGYVTSTPSFRDYNNIAAENYGAGGDLVFALNKNRMG